MNKLFFTKAEGIYDRLDKILRNLLGYSPEILRTENGKPYIGNNPLYFSLSHSGKYGIIAVCDRPVGADLEIFKDKSHNLLVTRFPSEEQAEITDERQFLLHWTAREAFIKMKGGTLAKDLKSTSYSGGKIHFEGAEQNCDIQQHFTEYGVITVCIEE